MFHPKTPDVNNNTIHKDVYQSDQVTTEKGIQNTPKSLTWHEGLWCCQLNLVSRWNEFINIAH